MRQQLLLRLWMESDNDYEEIFDAIMCSVCTACLM
jgi:hypothetical protein